MAAQSRAGRAERPIGQEAGLPVAEVKLPVRETRLDVEKPGHGVHASGRVDEAAPQHHVATAFTVDWPLSGKDPKAVHEVARVRDPPRMEFGVPAREPAGVALFGRRLVVKRREPHDLGPGVPPALEHVRVEEREGGIARHRDPLAGRMDGRMRSQRRDRREIRPGKARRGRCGEQSVEIDMRGHDIRRSVDASLEVAGFAGLYEAEVALGQDKALTARDGAEDRETRPATASETSRRCRSLAMRLRITPAILIRGS